jgi:beta-N-acetylhexosaminidase
MSTPVDEILSRLTVEQKIGQLVMATVPGTEMDEATAARLREGHYSGVVLFSRNIASVPQTLALTAAIRDCCTVAGLPPIIGVDQEGGRVRRLMAEATATPSAMALGATGDPALVERIGAAVGRELRALGINTDFAPVADVNNNPLNPVIGTRSFGESPERVGEMVVAFARGLRSTGVAATAKHFPGHGDTHIDSHLDLPTIPHDLDRLRAVELPPFAAAIRAGVPLVMTSHIRFPALEPDGMPATLSPRILNGLLRDEMGFAGVIISDAMVMKAIATYYGVVAGSVQAVIAGNDIVEPLSLPDEPAVVAGLRDAVGDGRLPMTQLDASIRRILRLKRWLAEQQAVGIEVVGAHGTLVREAAGASVALLDARAGTLPIAANSIIAVVEFALQSTHAAEEGQAAPSPLRDAFQQQFADVRGVALDATDPTADDLAAALRLAAEAAVVIIGTRDANLFPAQRAAIDALQAADRPTTFVSMRAPYDLADFAWAAARLATYGDLPASLAVAAAICAGAQTPRGHLPVSVGPLYPVGHGLTVVPV